MNSVHHHTRKFLPGPVLLTACVMCGIFTLHSAPLDRTARIRALRMDVFACGADLSWHTYGRTISFVEYGPSFKYRGRVSSTASTFHEARLSGLKPERAYEFRIIVRRADSIKASLTYRIRTRKPRLVSAAGIPGRNKLKTALSRAGACDTVLVPPDTYKGNFVVPPGVRLVSANVRKTILDGGGKGSVVTMGDDSRIKGFTIRNSGKNYWNAGIHFDGSVSPVIENNRIENNGMGLLHYCWEVCRGTPRIERNVIVNNTQTGLYLDKAAARINGNTIHGNGEGIHLNVKGFQLTNNIITNNRKRAIKGIDPATFPRNDVRNNLFHGNGPGGYHSPGLGPDDIERPGNFKIKPLWRNPDGGDFRPSAGSPVRGAGTDGKDLGASFFKARGTRPSRPAIEIISAGRFRVRPSEEKGPYYLYISTDGKHCSRRIAVSGGDYVLDDLPTGREIRVALSAAHADGESELSPFVSIRTPVLAPGIHQENAAGVRALGWRRVRDGKSMGGAYLVSSRPGARLRFSFHGDSLVLYRFMHPEGGTADVLVDGRHRGKISFRFSKARRGVPVVLNHLGPGPHRVQLRVGPGAGRVTLDAFRFPSPYAPRVDERRAPARVNFHRRIAGLAPLRDSSGLRLAARSHSAYFLANRGDRRAKGLGFHGEHPDRPDFTGLSPGARARYFGYSGTVTEVGNFTGDPGWAVDGWMRTVYHRNGIMDFAATEMGYGSAAHAGFQVETLNTGHGIARPRLYPGKRFIYTYPAHNQLNVPHDWDGAEFPNPLPKRTGHAPVGFPLSLYIAQPGETTQARGKRKSSPEWRVQNAGLREAGGRKIKIHVLEAGSDPNRLLKPDTVFLIAQSPLKLGTRYTAYITGMDSRGVAFSHRWSFKTWGPYGLQSLHADPRACQALIRWRTAGITTSHIEYAPLENPSRRKIQRALGTRRGARTAKYTRLHGLRPNTAYRYRVVTRHRGRDRFSAYRRFRTRGPRTFHVPGKYPSIQKAFKAAGECDSIVVAPGEYTGPFRIPRGVKLRGTDRDRTVLRGDGRNSVVRPADTSEITGFTITGSGKGYWHSGIWLEDAENTVVRNNRIRGNANGIVQYCFNKPCRASTLITGNLITGNNRRGIYVRNGRARIHGNIIRENRGKALDTARGVGVEARDNQITTTGEPAKPK